MANISKFGRLVGSQRRLPSVERIFNCIFSIFRIVFSFSHDESHDGEMVHECENTLRQSCLWIAHNYIKFIFMSIDALYRLVCTVRTCEACGRLLKSCYCL
jgi:hypothetical protein